MLSKRQMRDHPRSTRLYLGPQADILVFVLLGFVFTRALIFEKSQFIPENSAVKCFEVLP